MIPFFPQGDLKQNPQISRKPTFSKRRKFKLVPSGVATGLYKVLWSLG